MEYDDTNIHKNEDVIAKSIPNASTLNAIGRFGSISTTRHVITLPSRIGLSIEITSPNLINAATNVQPSRMFGYFPNARIKTDATIDTSTARSGVIELISVTIMITSGHSAQQFCCQWFKYMLDRIAREESEVYTENTQYHHRNQHR